MTRSLMRTCAGAMVLGGWAWVTVQGAPERTAAVTRDDHPGNVFLSGERVTIPIPATIKDAVKGWILRDHTETEQARGTVPGDVPRIDGLGALPIGWYRVDLLDPEDNLLTSVSAAVLARPLTPPRLDSPVCADSATAWFARDSPERQAAFAYLAALARVNWIRDRMSWGDLEPEQGQFADNGNYDTAARAHAAYGLQSLQVFHSTPAWAGNPALDPDETWKRFPRDLRHQYRFCREMAVRFAGTVAAWEPWNEANIPAFGGHTIDEMCALQKAAWLGYKAAEPDLTVCWNVYAGGGTALHTEGVLANETWPYFDTYNVHSYQPAESYPGQFDGARDAASGRPIWISECGIRLPAQADTPGGDLSAEDQRRQARFIATSYASSLFAGIDRHFFFILGNYNERGTQFGLLRRDHTPRPGYVALAAVGRFLDGARCLGRVPPAGGPNRIYAFRAFPDGIECDVLVAWSAEATPLPLLTDAGITVREAADMLGRPLAPDRSLKIGPEPIFLLLNAGAAEGLRLERPPERAPTRDGTPSPVVLQAAFHHDATDLNTQAHIVDVDRPVTIPVHVYNFSDEPVTGTVAVEGVQRGWQARLPDVPVTVGPMERETLQLSAAIAGNTTAALEGAWLKLRGDFGAAGNPVQAFRLMARVSDLTPAREHPVPCAAREAAWTDNINHDATLTHRADGRGMRFDMTFGQADPWSYPRLTLTLDDAPSPDDHGIAFTIRVHDGEGTLRVQFVERGGAAYLGDMGVSADVHTPQDVVVLFGNTQWGPWSKTDEDAELVPTDIRHVLFGINGKRGSSVAYTISNVRWVRY